MGPEGKEVDVEPFPHIALEVPHEPYLAEDVACVSQGRGEVNGIAALTRGENVLPEDREDLGIREGAVGLETRGELAQLRIVRHEINSDEARVRAFPDFRAGGQHRIEEFLPFVEPDHSLAEVETPVEIEDLPAHDSYVSEDAEVRGLAVELDGELLPRIREGPEDREVRVRPEEFHGLSRFHVQVEENGGLSLGVR